MPIPPASIVAAEQIQEAAANSANAQVRLIAGPGTGKSSTIEKRVRWLLDQGIETQQIHVVSFTRASSRELQERITEYCESHGHLSAGQVEREEMISA